MRAGHHARGGFALVAVLWVAAILSVVAVGYATSARLKGFETLQVQRRAALDYLLTSALTVGRFEYQTYVDNKELATNAQKVESITEATVDLWYPRYEPYQRTMEGHVASIRVVGAGGKLDTNAMTPVKWDNLLLVLGVNDPAERTSLTNSILDWCDADDLVRQDGAETPDYEAMDPPYLCKNAPLENIEELLYVRGVTPRLFEGDETHPGLRDVLSVGSGADKLDVNCAAPRAFLLIPGITDEAIQAIVELRDKHPIAKLDDLQGVLNFDQYSALREHFTVGQSGSVVIEATIDGITAKEVMVTQ